MQQHYRRTPIPKLISTTFFCKLLKSHFGMGVLLKICCIFSEHISLRAPLEGYFCRSGAEDCSCQTAHMISCFFLEVLSIGWYCNFNVYMQKQPTEVFYKKGFLKNSSNSQESTCVRVFFNNVIGLRPTTLLKMRLWHRCFPVNFTKFLRTPFFTKHLQTAVSAYIEVKHFHFNIFLVCRCKLVYELYHLLVCK